MIIYLRCADVNTQNYNFCLLVTLTNKLCNVFLLLEPPLQRINFFFSSASHKCFKTYFIQTFCTVEKSRNIHIYMEEERVCMHGNGNTDGTWIRSLMSIDTECCVEGTDGQSSGPGPLSNMY